MSPKARQAHQLLQSYQDENGNKLNVVHYNGELYGFDPQYSIEFSNSSCVGFCLSFGGGKTIRLGKEFTLGFSLKPSLQSVDLSQRSGINFANSYSKAISELSVALNGESPDVVLQKILNMTAQTNQIFMSQLEQRKMFQSKNLMTFRKSLELEKLALPDVKPPTPRNYSEELQKSLKTLNETLDEEVVWQGKVRSAVDSTIIVNDQKMNQFIQNVCDRVSVAYQVPEKLWPRCRVAAEIIPNAWAYPGGDLFFSVGLIGMLKSLDGLMYVVGHEIGHVVGKHTTRMTPGYNALSGLATVLSFGLNAFQVGSIRELFTSTHVLSAMGKTFAQGQILSHGANFTMMAGTAAVMMHGRDNERQADRFGQETSFAAGASSEGLISGQRDMKNFINQISPPQTFLSKIMASHPSADERIENMSTREELVKRNLGEFNAANPLPETLVNQYSAYHQWAAVYLDQFMTQQKAKSKGSANSFEQLFLNAYASKGSQCLFHVFDLDHRH
jgi:Zn-dependent protease with chaperone function